MQPSAKSTDMTAIQCTHGFLGEKTFLGTVLPASYVVRQQHVNIIERLGRFAGTDGPGSILGRAI